jgi:O-antigen/teichoic acid export membrane protein
MNEHLAELAGSAIRWKAIQLVGIGSIRLVRTLVMARLLAPDDFGLLAIAMVAVDLLMGVSDFGMIPALIQRTETSERHYNAAWTVGFIRGLAITVMVALAAPLIAELFAEPRATEIIRVLALRPVLDAIASIKLAHLTRNLNFRSLTFVSLPGALINTVVSISLAHSWGVWALVAGVLTGQVAYVILSYILAPHRPRFSLDRTTARPLVNYGRWIFVTGLVAMTGNALLQSVISRQLGTAELGLYALATTLAFIPNEIANAVVGPVSFPLYARLQQELEQVARVFRGILTGMAAILMPVCVLLFALTPQLVEHILGPKWAGSTSLIRLLVLVNVVGLPGDVIVPILKGLGWPRRVFNIELFQSSLLILFVALLVAPFGVMGVPLAWLLAVGAAQVLSLLFLARLVPRPYEGLRLSLLGIGMTSVVGGGIAWVVAQALPTLAGLLLAGSIGGGTTLMLLALWDRWLGLGLRTMLVQLLYQTFPRWMSRFPAPVPERSP